MSSPMKDARWQLATVLAEEAGFDSVNALPFAVTEHLLSTANFVLLQLPEEKVQKLADRWNSTDTPTEVEFGIRNTATGKVGYPFTEEDAHRGSDGLTYFEVVKRRPASEWENA